jgi:hypothetical protein
LHQREIASSLAMEIPIARSKPKAPKPAPTPDELIKTGKDGRIRLIEKRQPRRPRVTRKSG